eukprot:7139930-Prymnesium_polylepis.1
MNCPGDLPKVGWDRRVRAWLLLLSLSLASVAAAVHDCARRRSQCRPRSPPPPSSAGWLRIRAHATSTTASRPSRTRPCTSDPT